MIEIKRRSRFKRLLFRYYKNFIIEQRIGTRGTSKFFIMRKVFPMGNKIIFSSYRSLSEAERDLKLLVRRMLHIKVYRRNARISRTKINR